MRWMVALALGVMLAWPMGSRAQPSEEGRTAAARALFTEGMRAVDEADFETASDRLRRSLELRESAVVRTNLALALIELGRLVEATEHLRRVQRDSEEGSDVHQVAVERLAFLEPQLGRLRIVLHGARDDVELHLDGEPVLGALIGVTQPVDPGDHHLTLVRRGVPIVTRSVTTPSGRGVTVELEVPAAEPDVAAEAFESAMSADGSPRETEAGGIETEWWFWALAGLVVVGAGIGIAVGVHLSSQPPEPSLRGDDDRTHLTLVEWRP